jgi:hypothetical protein
MAKVEISDDNSDTSYSTDFGIPKEEKDNEDRPSSPESSKVEIYSPVSS